MMTERKGPSRSEQTNQLIALCQQVLDGQLGPEGLEPLLSSRETGLVQAREDFFRNANSEGQEFALRWADSITAVLDRFDAYGAALGSIREFMRSRRKEQLQEGMDALATAADALLGAIDAYENRYLIDGPTDNPVLNMLIHTSGAVREGKLPKAEFERIVGETRTYFEGCLKEVTEPPPGQPQQALDRWKAALTRYLDGVNEMLRFVGDDNGAHLDTGLSMVREAMEMLKEGSDLYKRQYEEGPTPSKVANTYIHAAHMMKEGRFDRALFEQGLDQLDKTLRESRQTFESLCNVPTESVVIQEEIPRALEAYDLHEEANAAWRRYLQTNDPADLDEGIQKLTEAATRLETSKAIFEQSSERHGKVMCTKCFAPNENTSRTCVSCGAVLPRVEHLGEMASTFNMSEGGKVSADDDVVITEHLARIIQETNAVAEGKISNERYEETLQWMEGLLDDAERKLAATPFINPEAFPAEEREKVERERDMVEETKGLLREGIENTRYGLQQLRNFTFDGDQQHLIDGLRTVWEASRTVLHVQRIGEVASRNIVDSEGSRPPSFETMPLDDDEIEISKDE